LIELLLEPTRIYVKPLLQLLEQVSVHAFAHITGGGLTENIPRVLPEGIGVTLDAKSWLRPAIFDWLMREGGIAEHEMYRTFNMGLGMVALVAAADEARVLQALSAAGERAWRVGRVEKGIAGVVIR
jgi:phosphoribosylformylglycinamidine cyclo-ligase